MIMPQFTSEEEAREYLINTFKDFFKKIEEAKSHEEKVRIMKEFDMSEFNTEGQLLNGKPVKDYLEYQNAKTIVYGFFNWIETKKAINVFNVSTSDNFFNAMHGEKTLMVAQLIQTLPLLPPQLQPYFILNIFRTTYELNFKNMTLILHQSRIKQNKTTSDFYSLENFKNEFSDYPKINDLLNYFKNDIRNPVAHEDWFVKNGLVWTKNKNIEKNQGLQEISEQINDLFYFRVALTTYLLEHYKEIIKDKDISEQQLSNVLNSIKLKLKELEK